MGIAIEAIASAPLAGRLIRFTGESRRLTYYLARRNGRELVGGRQRQVQGLSNRESRFIRRFLKRIDKLTGLSFERVRSREDAVMTVFSLKRYADPSVIGSTYFTKDGYDVSWKNQQGGRLGRNEAITIQHEILHVLGLDHPYGNGFNRAYDTSDTLMSYFNRRGYDKPTAADQAALLSLWGA